MHPSALDDSIDDLLFRPQGEADDFGVVWTEFSEDGAIGGVVAGGEHLLDIGGSRDALRQRAAMDGAYRRRIRRQHDHRLDRHRIVDVAVFVAIGFANDGGILGDDAADEERRHIKSLPLREIVAQHDGEFGVEHEDRSPRRGFRGVAVISPELLAEGGRGLERSCEPASGERILAAPASVGLERIEARFFGAAYARHRHDTYALGLTLAGVQTFWYRGAQRRSLPGQILVLHPDEIHDGGAGDETGLRYRMLYVEPALLSRAVGEGAAPPFVAEPVFDDPALRGVLAEALGALDAPLGELEG